MKKKSLMVLLVCSVCLLLLPLKEGEAREEERAEFVKYFDAAGVSGAMVVYDQKNDLFSYVNRQRCREGFLPASTFKIPNSLIGLETGVIPDADYLLPWDKQQRDFPDWNRDHTLRSAFQYSVVWYYQELARRVGAERMRQYLERIGYGNGDIGGRIDHFWLTGALRISPDEQINFLRRLHDNELPFSKRTLDQVKEIMLKEKTADYVLRAKTGWANEPADNVGWYVGYLETGDNVYYFATVLTAPKPVPADFTTQRIRITNAVLHELGIF
ncbi:class D beta-lactamase [Azotosporobacter soli]|uniref:class D beta-lactamase n=1 Tax=Azotosporobacter soli TaxID=3055040 RepID=UPI0031FE73DB